MNYKYVFTVFTPTYNRAILLHRVFDSLLSQTLKENNGKPIFEWLIVDDGSSDGTSDVVAEFKARADFPIRYIYQENKGKNSAHNLAAKIAEGELFLIADSDDGFKAETIEFFYKIWSSLGETERAKCGSIVTACEDENGRRITKKIPHENKLIKTTKLIFGEPLGETWGPLKTADILKYGLFPIERFKFVPESYIWNKIAIMGNTYCYCSNNVLRKYYVADSSDSLSVSARVKYADGFEFESLSFINEYKWICLLSPKYFIMHCIKYILLSAYNNKSRIEALKAIKKAFSKIMFLLLYFPAMILLYKKYLGTK